MNDFVVAAAAGRGSAPSSFGTALAVHHALGEPGLLASLVDAALDVPHGALFVSDNRWHANSPPVAETPK